MIVTVFLGGGRITSALLAGLRLSGSSEQFIVHDRHPAKLRDLKKHYGAIAESDLRRALEKADLLIVAVRPDSLPDLFRTIGKLNRSLLSVSLAAGVRLRKLKRGLGPPVRWARAMPSPASRGGHGLSAVTFPRELSRQDRKRVIQFFAKVGQVVEIPESKFDAFTVTYSSSHGYHALATLSEAAERVGLDRKTAMRAAAHALADGIIAWRDGSHSLRALLEEAATPGGIAATTMSGMDKAGYSRAVQKGIVAGLRRARVNAKN
jgi:pyrroline-5-carboxylate reductase